MSSCVAIIADGPGRPQYRAGKCLNCGTVSAIRKAGYKKQRCMICGSVGFALIPICTHSGCNHAADATAATPFTEALCSCHVWQLLEKTSSPG